MKKETEGIQNDHLISLNYFIVQANPSSTPTISTILSISTFSKSTSQIYQKSNSVQRVQLEPQGRASRGLKPSRRTIDKMCMLSNSERRLEENPGREIGVMRRVGVQGREKKERKKIYSPPVGALTQCPHRNAQLSRTPSQYPTPYNIQQFESSNKVVIKCKVVIIDELSVH